jgi:uncharacterized protein
MFESMPVGNLASNTYTSFDGHQRIASGTLHDVALAVKRAIENGADKPILIFEDATGRSLDLDMRGSEEAVLKRLGSIATTKDQTLPEVVDTDTPVVGQRERGRPKLGVVAREVTLLPRHWEWLATQPGGASVALRKLVEEARKTHSDKNMRRQAHERAYRFMSAVAGNLPEFEEVTRALFANDQARFREFAVAWPNDVREYALRLAFGADETVSPHNS